MIYSPREDSYLLEKQVRKYTRGKSFLDIGSGSGIQSKAAIAAKAKSVLASDVSSEVIDFLKSKNLSAVKSNLFSKIKGKFDVIAFNPPYLPEDKREDAESRLATTGGRKGDEMTLKFIKQAEKHLNKDGVILLVVSSLTPKTKILRLLKSLSLNKKTLAKERFFFEELEVWKISRKSL